MSIPRLTTDEIAGILAAGIKNQFPPETYAIEIARLANHFHEIAFSRLIEMASHNPDPSEVGLKDAELFAAIGRALDPTA